MQAVSQAPAVSEDQMGSKAWPGPGLRPALARGTVEMGQECRIQDIWGVGELASTWRPQRWMTGVPGSQGQRGGGVGGTREAHENSYIQEDVPCPSLIVAFPSCF